MGNHTKTHRYTQYNFRHVKTYGDLMDVSGRLRAKMLELGFNESELGRRSTVPQPTINRILSGESSSPRKPTLEALARALGVSPDWLLFGGYGELDQEPGVPSEKEYALIPQFTAKGSSGNGFLNDHVEIKGELAFKREWLRKMGLREENLRVLYNQGESNWPTLTDSEVLLADISKREPANGKMFAMVDPDGELIIKRLIRDIAGGWIIRSDNQDKTRYPDMPISDEGIRGVEIVGRIVWRGGGI